MNGIREIRANVAARGQDAAMKAIVQELREALLDIDEASAEGKSIVPALDRANTINDILDRIAGLDPRRLTDW